MTYYRFATPVSGNVYIYVKEGSRGREEGLTKNPIINLKGAAAVILKEGCPGRMDWPVGMERERLKRTPIPTKKS